jgi:hypothetical protein
MRINPTQIKTLHYLQDEDRPCTTGDIAHIIGINHATVRGNLNALWKNLLVSHDAEEELGDVSGEESSRLKGWEFAWEITPLGQKMIVPDEAEGT